MHVAAVLEQPGPLWREVFALLRRYVHAQQPAGEIIGQPVVEVAVLPVLGDLCRHLGVLAPLDFLLHRREVGLRQGTGQFGNHRGGDNDALAVGHPLGVGNGIRQFEELLGFAAVGAHEIERRRFVLPALGNEGETLAVGAPRRRIVGGLRRRQPPRGAAGHVNEPEAGGAFVFLDGPILNGEHRGLAIRRERGAAQAFHEPDVLRGDGALVGRADGDRQRQREDERAEAGGFHSRPALSSRAGSQWRKRRPSR